MIVRSFRSVDVVSLAGVHSGVFPGDPVRPKQILRRFERAIELNGQVLVVAIGGRPVGYAAARAIPGLDAVYELQGCIGRAHQRAGLGSQLLQKLLEDLANRGAHQVSCAVESFKSPTGRFLIKRGFFVEHVEWQLVLDDLSQIPQAALPERFRLETIPDQKAAIRRFRRLYEASFIGLPWYQPYGSDAEVAAELADPSELLFLLEGQKPVGFAWLRWSTLSIAEIEPVGIVPSHQGRGLARPLLQCGLSELADQGADQVKIGAWRDNSVALHLYRSLGFRHRATLSYLAYNLERET